VHVLLGGLGVVYGAQPRHAFLPNEGKGGLLWVGTDLCHEHVDSQIELFALDQ